MLGITLGALRLPLCYVQMPASGWFVGEGLDPPAGLCAAASVPGDTAPPLAIAVGRGSLTPPRRPEAGRPTIFMEDVRWLTGRRKRRPLQLQFFLKFLLDNRSISCYIVSVS